jgi:drug/metabolite transporter (DMT)-like permease
MGLGAAALFGLGAIFVKFGMRRMKVDNGHFMSVLVNVLSLGALMLFVALPEWDWTGFAGFILAGVMTTFLGRGTSFKAIRLLGPSRQSAILVSSPLFAAIAGWFVLNEAITPLQALGGAVVTIGLLVLVRSHGGDEDEQPAAHDALGGYPGDVTVATRRERVRTAVKADPFLHGFLVAIASSVFFGAGFVARKWSLGYWPSAVGGAFLGAATALSLILLRAAGRGRLGRLINDNLRNLPWWFVAGGLTSTLALILQFHAFDHLPAWIVSLLQGTQGVWTLLFAYIFLRREERLGAPVVVSVALVTAGVAIMTYGL